MRTRSLRRGDSHCLAEQSPRRIARVRSNRQVPAVTLEYFGHFAGYRIERVFVFYGISRASSQKCQRTHVLRLLGYRAVLLT
jgi:hypothetical protein